jgi:hypothetical protein
MTTTEEARTPGQDAAETKTAGITLTFDPSKLFDVLAEVGDGGSALGCRIVGIMLTGGQSSFREDVGLAFYGVSAAPAATPAPSSPGVPDSVRALSEAVASTVAEAKQAGDLYNAAARRAERTFEDLTEVYEAFECADKKLWQAKDALADHCLALLSAHPAGQSTGQGAARDALARLRARDGEDVEAWANSLGADLARAGEAETAPDSTRTGPVETEDAAAHQRDMALEALHTLGVRIGLLDPNVACDGPQLLAAIDAYSDELAARPEAPEAQGAWQDISGLAVKQRAVLGRWCRCGDAEDGSEHWYWQRGAGFFFEHLGERHWSLDSGTFEGAPFYGSQPTHFLAVPPPPARPAPPASSGQESAR